MKKKSFIDVVNKFLVVSLITIIIMIFLNKSPDFKEKFYKNVYEKSINFTRFNTLYKKYFRSPVLDVKKTKAVFSEKLEYKGLKKYMDGVEVSVANNYLVPAINSGMVIFKGEKDNYGSVIIIEQVDGTQTLYGNINSNLNMYDYVDKGEVIGDASGKLYLMFKKEDNILNYEDYI